MSETPSIHEWIGGTGEIRRWPYAFYDEVERDPALGPVFGGVVSTEHREHVTAWWAEVMGGPADYTELLGGYEHMLTKTEDWRSHRTSGCASSPCSAPRPTVPACRTTRGRAPP